jgi:hypothetical protein
MKLRGIVCALIAVALFAPLPARAQAGEPGRCANDSKLLNNGPTLVYGEGSNTWWGLIIGGLNTAGLDTDEEKIDYLNHVFGTDYGTLAELEIFNQNLVADNWDLNHNGYVCAYELRGTRAYLDDPFVNFTFFGISDDKVRK